MQTSPYLIVITLLLLSSCSSTKNNIVDLQDCNKQIDTRLAGTWGGSESDQQVIGMSKEWKSIRYDDGSFRIYFTVTQNGKTYKSHETGLWWVVNNFYYEYHDASKMTDVYTYEILDKKRTKFKAHIQGVAMVNDAYEFIDNRIKK